ncbi:type I glutamate--ammonia ligase [Desulfotomaculum copahuensis]|uniref:Glutamine synthetase n=1 Tax=Desulfotomaculum copahuensis TaxID=1838280 RepID=A0A1B7LBX1_9FIRM|nr:type I glutamate--ammonia ligase [Desulfotomaculum copahuensis]OAT79974.1 type I glutamate--ammonia ligase [Desulfotomaculum copahuensis]
MTTRTKEDVLQKARDYDVKFIRLQFTDIFGAFKNIAVTVEELSRALDGRVMFDSSVIEGFVENRESDIYLQPDPTTFVIFPWRPRDGAVARLICDVRASRDQAYSACSRTVLKNVLQRAEQLGLSFQVGAQIEFFLFHTDAQGKPTVITHDQAGYCDLTPVDLGENARRDMVLTLQEMGFDVSSSHHEVAPGQHEIFLKENDALLTADNIATFKFVVRTIAQRHGLHASFMPRPLAAHNGSGMHLHQFLWRNGENAFYHPADPRQLSDLAYCFIAGLIEHAGALTAIANPLVNSYKRLAPSDLAPVLAAWSEENRATMLRVPAMREEGTRLILRSPDPAANPYLTLAVSLAAGLDGIERNLAPPEPLPENGPNLRLLMQKTGLPRHLSAALAALSGDGEIRRVLGGHITTRYLTAKENEWERYQSRVHQWELDEYLTNF